MAKALRDTALTVVTTSAGISATSRPVIGASRTHFDVSSIQRTIARWERRDVRIAPGEYYQRLLGLLFARMPTGAIVVGPGSDFSILLTAFRHFGISPERIEQLTMLITQATERSRREAEADSDGRPLVVASPLRLGAGGRS